MVTAIARDGSEPPSPKRLKQEEPSSNETNSKNTMQAISSARPEPEDEDLERFDEEWLKSGGFDVDFSKLRFTFGAGAVDLEDSDLVREPDTNRNLLNRLTEMSISYYKENTGISLELVNVLKANFHPSAAITLYITFEAIDSSDGNQTKPFHAVVRYLPRDIEVVSCRPKP
uniref:Cystatin domain-containing protein n=1 Tax=Noccaea caerulescens TaxID=107243 RepID=A0A1J3ECT9_NOCCA